MESFVQITHLAVAFQQGGVGDEVRLYLRISLRWMDAPKLWVIFVRKPGEFFGIEDGFGKRGRSTPGIFTDVMFVDGICLILPLGMDISLRVIAAHRLGSSERLAPGTTVGLGLRGC